VCKLEAAEAACGRVGGVLRRVGGEALAAYVAVAGWTGRAFFSSGGGTARPGRSVGCLDKIKSQQLLSAEPILHRSI
jgi:hypothetical protein